MSQDVNERYYTKDVEKAIEEMEVNPENFEKVMKMAARLDPETGHVCGDDLMCKVLKHIGFAKGVEVFENMEKWYA